MTRPAMPAHVERFLEWIKDPNRKPYRISINPLGHAIVRCGSLVLGARDTLDEAFALIEEHIATPWERAA